MVKIEDLNLDLREVVAHRAREIGEPDGLEPHVGVVEVLDRRLD
jgi:hypothetical protein